MTAPAMMGFVLTQRRNKGVMEGHQSQSFAADPSDTFIRVQVHQTLPVQPEAAVPTNERPNDPDLYILTPFRRV